MSETILAELLLEAAATSDKTDRLLVITATGGDYSFPKIKKALLEQHSQMMHPE